MNILACIDFGNIDTSWLAHCRIS